MAQFDEQDDPAAHAGQSDGRLHQAIAALDPPVFAVLDGGLFDDLPAWLKAAGFSHRSLFLDHADAEIERAGPWLAALPEEGDAARLPNVDGAAPAVFWAGAPDELALHRHLRTLNLARIPDWAAEGREAPPGDADVYATVMFRHWDASVLGDFLPVLHEDQLARVLGPAGALAFMGEDGRMKRLASDPAWPPPAPGMLTITSAQIAALTARRIEASRRRIAKYLRDVAPDQTRGVTDDQLIYQVHYSEAVGKELGIRSERAQAQWAFMMVMSKGAVANQPQVTGFIRKPGVTADDQVGKAMEQLVAAAREQDKRR